MLIDTIIHEDIYGNKSLYERLKEETKEINLDGLISKIVDWKVEERHSYIKIKIDRVMVSSEYIAQHLAIYSIGMRQTIQEFTIAMSKVIREEAAITFQESIVLAGELIGLGKDIIYTINPPNIKSLFTLSKDTIEYIQGKMYIPPQLIPPREWISNTEGGFQSFDSHIQLGKFPNNEIQCLDTINYLQSIPLKLDSYITNMEEEPNKELVGESLEQFDSHVKQAKKLYREYESKPFHFIWKYDKRGRIYSLGFHINIQAYGYKKACISLANKYHITGEL